MNRSTLLWLPVFPVLLFGCGDFSNLYSHSMAWSCLSPEGCARADIVVDFDRASIGYTRIHIGSTSDDSLLTVASRIPSDDVPEGCDLLVGLTLFGHALESLTICRVTGRSGGYSVELSIPDPNPASASEWRIEMRPL